MKMMELNWTPSDRQLRQFGWIALFAFPLAAWLVTGRPALSTWSTGYTLLIVGLALVGASQAALGLLRPHWVKPTFIAMSLIAFPIGLVVSQIVLMFIFYLVFAPVGLFFRLIRRDALERSWDPNASTYWSPKAQPADVARYYRQS